MSVKKKHKEDELDAQAAELMGEDKGKTESLFDFDLETAAKKIAELEDALSKAEEKSAANWDKLLRSEAEKQNLARQSQVAVEKAHKFGNEKIIAELIQVLDSFDQGLASIEGAADKHILEGMHLTYKLMRDTLSKFGVEAIDPSGQPFDPQFHETLSVLPTKDVPDNHVYEVVQKGYTLNGRLIRPARVVVAQGS